MTCQEFKCGGECRVDVGVYKPPSSRHRLLPVVTFSAANLVNPNSLAGKPMSVNPQLRERRFVEPQLAGHFEIADAHNTQTIRLANALLLEHRCNKYSCTWFNNAKGTYTQHGFRF